MRRSLEDVTERLSRAHRLIRELRICFVLEGAAEQAYPIEPILPSSPSVAADLLADLIALRLENLRLPDAVAAIRMSAETVEERNIQSELFAGASKQSRREVDRVFARLRGMFGNGCIQRAVPEDEHIPERSYSWEDLGRMPWQGEEDQAVPVRPAVPVRQAVRRIFADPCTPPQQGYTVRGGPYTISGRWWCGERLREYCYAETRCGEILWLCYDGAEGRWRQIGIVE
jgi:protein ImuB